MDQSPKNLSKLLGQIVKAFSFNSETDKTDFEPKTPLDNNNVQAAEEALDHEFPSSSLSSFVSTSTTSSFTGNSPIRLVIYRSTDCKEKEKILFDSLYVTDEGKYLPQKDAKFLKDTVLDFAFGSMPLKNPETTRFTKLEDEIYAFAIVFNLSTSTSSTTHSPRRPPPFQDSSTSSSSSASSSSSGYSSLPILDDQSCDYSSSSSSLNPSHSLPATPCHFMRACGSRYRNPRLTMGAVLLFSNQITPTVLEPLLVSLQAFVTQTYIRSKSKFSIYLKSYSNCLSHDVQNYHKLIEREIPRALEILPLFSLRIFGEFIAFLSTNPSSKVSVVASSKTNNLLALALFKICYLIKNFKTYFPPTSSPQKATTTSTPNPDLDSGFFSCTTIRSTSICDEDEELICDSGSSSVSVVEEKPRNKFYLGDEEDDEQTEEKLGLSEPMKEKLFPNQQQQSPTVKLGISVKDVPLELDSVVTNKPKTEHYYLNNSARFSPFQTYQLFTCPPQYDTIHIVTNEILEINLEKLSFRAINPKEEPTQKCKDTIRGLIAKTRNLTKLITDTEKTLFFFLVHLVENMK